MARIAIDDDVKPEAANLVAQLKKMNIIPVLLSGDKKSRCLKVARQIGIDEVHAETLPDEKASTVIDIYRQKGKTIMIGDGINDAPALTRADVGVSMNDASQVAIQSARVVLLNTDLGSVVKFLQISKHTLITIKQNLFWAFAYNSGHPPGSFWLFKFGDRCICHGIFGCGSDWEFAETEDEES